MCKREVFMKDKKEYMKRYYAENKEKVAEYMKRYYQKKKLKQRGYVPTAGGVYE